MELEMATTLSSLTGHFEWVSLTLIRKKKRKKRNGFDDHGFFVGSSAIKH